LFDAFSQAHSTLIESYGGTGLGLTISKQLIELMQGYIDFESKEGIGSSFWIVFPIVEHTGGALPAPASVKELVGLKLLFTDDNAHYRKIISEQARRWGVEVTTTKNGEEAIERYMQAINDSSAFDIIMCDIEMPLMDGFGLAKSIDEISTRNPPPFILLSASRSIPDQKMLEGTCITLATEKPLVASDMRNVLCKALGISFIGSQASSSVKDTIDLPKMNILVAEDNDVNRMVIEKMLASIDQQVTLVKDGKQAVAAYQSMAKEAPYDLVFMDCEMPILNGYKATKAIREYEYKQNLPHTRIVALTAHVLESESNLCQESGMDSHLSKPLKKEQLIEILKELKVV